MNRVGTTSHEGGNVGPASGDTDSNKWLVWNILSWLALRVRLLTFAVRWESLEYRDSLLSLNLLHNFSYSCWHVLKHLICPVFCSAYHKRTKYRVEAWKRLRQHLSYHTNVFPSITIFHYFRARESCRSIASHLPTAKLTILLLDLISCSFKKKLQQTFLTWTLVAASDLWCHNASKPALSELSVPHLFQGTIPWQRTASV